MKADWIKARQTKYSAYVTVYILVILAVLGVANFLANRYDKSYDSTANKQFSLSDQTIKAVKGLEERCHCHLLRRDQPVSASPRPAGPLCQPVSQVPRRLHRPGEEAAVGAGRGRHARKAPSMVDTGVRKEDAKSLTEEEITGALIRVAEGRRAQRLLPDAAAASTPR